MPKPVILLADPGIDGAFAIALALGDPELDVIGIAASAGNVSSEEATRNVQILVAHCDPPKWPRLGEALAAAEPSNAAHLHGAGGLGGHQFQHVELHHPYAADKLIGDLVNDLPGQVTLVAMAPLTALARALDRTTDLPRLIKQIIVLGGNRFEPGNATAVAEFHFHCDPAAARQVLRCRAPITLIPLDIMRKALFSPKDLVDLPSGDAPICELLRKIAPCGINASAQHYGIEGFYLKDVLGVAAVAVPEAFKLKPMVVDVETQGELTRGMSVFDVRASRGSYTNVEAATDVDMRLVRAYMLRIFNRIAAR